MKRSVRTWCAVTVFLLCLSLFSCAEELPPTQVKHLTWAIGTVLPEAEDFLSPLTEGATVEFADGDPYTDLQLGENQIRLVYHPPKGRKQSITATLTMINDTTPPEIHGLKELMAYVGEGVAYRGGITLTDNCDSEVTLEVDSSAVDTSKEGVYPVFYWARDAAGNTSVQETKVHVYAERITREMLYAQIDPIAERLGLWGLGKEDQARAVYGFVHTDAGIVYVDTSDKTDWVREAYFCLMNRQGDCFSYFALSKAFFERLGIENLDIQRTPGFTDDTHYWSLINIAKAGDPARWYHYDATRLRGVSYSGCLLTDAQVDAFSRLRPSFYLYDRSGYPTTSSVIITERPDLE